MNPRRPILGHPLKHLLTPQERELYIQHVLNPLEERRFQSRWAREVQPFQDKLREAAGRVSENKGGEVEEFLYRRAKQQFLEASDKHGRGSDSQEKFKLFRLRRHINAVQHQLLRKSRPPGPARAYLREELNRDFGTPPAGELERDQFYDPVRSLKWTKNIQDWVSDKEAQVDAEGADDYFNMSPEERRADNIFDPRVYEQAKEKFRGMAAAEQARRDAAKMLAQIQRPLSRREALRKGLGLGLDVVAKNNPIAQAKKVVDVVQGKNPGLVSLIKAVISRRMSS